VKTGKVVAGSSVNIARVGIGVMVKEGAPKPDVSSVDAFKKAISKSKLIRVAKAGHAVGQEKPAAVLEAIREFFLNDIRRVELPELVSAHAGGQPGYVALRGLEIGRFVHRGLQRSLLARSDDQNPSRATYAIA
jgi:hypothetical protein